MNLIPLCEMIFSLFPAITSFMQSLLPLKKELSIGPVRLLAIQGQT